MLVATSPSGPVVYPSTRETPLWPYDGRELEDADGNYYTLDDDSLPADQERPYAIARVRADESIDVELVDDTVSEPDDETLLRVGHLDAAALAAARSMPSLRRLVVSGPVDVDEVLPVLRRAEWWSQLERVTLLEPYVDNDSSMPGMAYDLGVPTVAVGFCENGRQVGWELALDAVTDTFAVTMVGWHETGDLEYLKWLLRRKSRPVLLRQSRYFQPTVADRELLSSSWDSLAPTILISEAELLDYLRARTDEEANAGADEPAAPPRFQSSDCTVFVIYAVSSRDAPVEPGLPTLVLEDAGELLDHFGRYESPYPIVLATGQLCERLETIRADWRPSGSYDEMITSVLRFAVRHRAAGWFVCVLEPPALAGKGTAIGLMGP